MAAAPAAARATSTPRRTARDASIEPLAHRRRHPGRSELFERQSRQREGERAERGERPEMLRVLLRERIEIACAVHGERPGHGPCLVRERRLAAVHLEPAAGTAGRLRFEAAEAQRET